MDPPCSAGNCGPAVGISGAEEDNLTSTETGNNSFHTLRLVSLLSLIFHSHSFRPFFFNGPLCAVLITACACVYCKNHALQETSHQSKATTQASFIPIHHEDPRSAWQNQLLDTVLLTLTGHSCCLIHLRSFTSVQSCAGTLADIILHYCFWLVVIFTQTSHHYLSSGTATTGPSNWSNKQCQSNCHGNSKKKEKKNITTDCPSITTLMTSQSPMRNLIFVVGQR